MQITVHVNEYANVYVYVSTTTILASDVWEGCVVKGRKYDDAIVQSGYFCKL